MAIVSRVEFAQRLLKLRTETMKIRSQAKLAQLAGVPETSYRQWESAMTYPSLAHLDRLAEFYSTTIDELIVRDESKEDRKD
jgi:transcriptional regulator with XRE-family HTH domain